MKLVFIGGTGPEGLGLAIRFAAAGHEVRIGSRSESRGREAADKVRAAVPEAAALGGSNEAVVSDADVVFLTFPYVGQKSTLETLAPNLAGKIVCSVVAPLKFEKGVGAVAVSVDGNSAAEECAAQLPDSRVVSAFQNMPADRLQDLKQSIPADVLVCGADTDAKQVIIELAGQIDGVRGIDSGGLFNSRYVEMLTSLLINLNRIHKTESSIRIVGIGA